MPTTNWNGVLMPVAGEDDLLTFWKAWADGLPVIIPVASVAAARLALDQAEAQGILASTTKPVMFRIGSAEGTYYECAGKTSAGVWRLKPFNEIEYMELGLPSSQAGTWNLAAGQWGELIRYALPIRPYDRTIEANGVCWARVTGIADLCVYIGETDVAMAQYTARAADESVAVPNAGKVLANQPASIYMGLRGQQAGTKVVISSEYGWNRLIVKAMPVTMA